MKKAKKLLALLIVAAMLLSIIQPISVYAVASTFAGGSGTEDDPYLISDKYQLDSVRNDLAAYYKLTCDIVFTESDFAEGGDFYNDGKGFEPIGKSFTGTFDGNGFAIKNLYINIESTSDPVYAGLFRYNKGTIKNLGIEDCNIYATSTAEKSSAYAGGIAGFNSSGTILNCYNTGNIYAATIEDADSKAYAGGIVGLNNKTISNCYNTGNIYASATIEHTPLNYYSPAHANAGGITGYTYEIISNCYNTGNIYASAANYTCAYAGGIVGHIRYTSVKNCYNTGDVFASSTTQKAYSGGITGYCTEIVLNCYNTGNISATSTADSAYSSGIAGYNERATISNCYNSGDILATSNATSANAIASGIAGTNYYGTISNSYNKGNISTEAKRSAFSSGIVGSNLGGTVSNCYNVGDASVTETTPHAYVGAIAGYNDKTLLNCYYLDNVSVGVGNGENTAIKCTSEEMKLPTTFVGFDFESVWKFDDTLVYHKYPVLKDVAHYEEFILGDVFLDAELNSKDIFRMKLLVKKMVSPTEAEKAAADVDSDGDIDISDLFYLKLRIIKGKWTL